MTTDETPIDLGTIEVPTVEVLNLPWIFRGAAHIKDPKVRGDVLGDVLLFGLILDLGFGVYHQIDAQLDSFALPEGMGSTLDDFADFEAHCKLVELFVASWVESAEPNPLIVETVHQIGRRWVVKLRRHELELKTLRVIGEASLDEALREQGLTR